MIKLFFHIISGSLKIKEIHNLQKLILIKGLIIRDEVLSSLFQDSTNLAIDQWKSVSLQVMSLLLQPNKTAKEYHHLCA